MRVAPNSLRRPVAAVLALLVGLIAVGAGAASAQDAEQTPPVNVTTVDASGSTVEVAVIGADGDTKSSAVSVVASGEAAPVESVASSADLDRPTEVVVIIDTNARADEMLAPIKRELTSYVDGLPPSTSVAIISAGDNAIVEAQLTTNKNRLAGAIDDLSPKNGSAIFNALTRAGDVFSDEPGVFRSVLVVTSGSDTASNTTLAEAQVWLIRSSTQVVAVSYLSPTGPVDNAVNETAGVRLSVGESSEMGSVFDEALTIASERLLVSFPGAVEPGTRGGVELQVGDSVAEFSYPAGVVTSSPLQLVPLPDSQDDGFALFRSSAGLYIALVLAFLGISLGIWSVGSIVTSSDGSLDGMLSRYIDGNVDTTDAEVEELIVQSAILQRAVNYSETFAEKRGFLARVEDMLERANLPVRAGEAMFIFTASIFLITGLFLVLTKSVLVAVLLGVFVGGIGFFVLRLLGRRRFRAFESQLPDTLQLLAGTLRAGYSLPQGMEAVSKEVADPMGQELRRAMSEARLGRDIEECLGGVAERLSSADFAWAVMAIGIQREVGGNLNELLNSVAETMVARERLKREISALTAEGRMSAGVLSFLPPGLGLVLWLMNPDYVELLFTDFLGNVLLALGLVSALTGLAWMKKVITVDV